MLPERELVPELVSELVPELVQELELVPELVLKLELELVPELASTPKLEPTPVLAHELYQTTKARCPLSIKLRLTTKPLADKPRLLGSPLPKRPRPCSFLPPGAASNIMCAALLPPLPWLVLSRVRGPLLCPGVQGHGAGGLTRS